MKAFAKIFTLSLCLLLCFTSCSLINEVKQEVARVQEFTADFVEVIEEPTVEKAEELVHPSSSLTAEMVIEKLKNNEAIKNLELSENTSVELSEISDITLLHNDATLGGNVYGVDMTVSVNGTPITISLTVLSTEEGMGVYDFDIK